MHQLTANHLRRLWLSLGGVGLALLAWVLLREAQIPDSPPAWVVCLIATISFAIAALSLARANRHEPVDSALKVALGLAVLCGLLAWCSLGGFANVRSFLRAPQTLIGLGLLATMPVPFLAAAQVRPGGWRDYRLLFRISWETLHAWVVALVFTGLVWLVLIASGKLLELVGITIVLHLLQMPPVIAALSGGFIGIGLAITAELPDSISSALLLRLLRVLTPLFLVVVALFLLAWSLQRSTDMPLAVLCIWATLLASTLISAVVAEDSDSASPSALLRGSARALAVLMPILASIAAWALWARVAQYGLTPERVLGLTATAVACGYGLLYGWAALRGSAWAQRIRRANIVMALAMLGLAVLWMTRIISPEALAASSQLARYAAGQTPAEQLPLDDMASQWGLPGERAYAQLEQLSAKDADLARQFQAASTAGKDRDHEQMRQRLLEQLPSLPADDPLRPGFVASLLPWHLDYTSRSCAEKTPDGHPGCLVVFADLDPARPGDEAVLLGMDADADLLVLGQEEDRRWEPILDFRQASDKHTVGELIDTLMRDGLHVEPVPLNMLRLGSADYIAPRPGFSPFR